MVKCFLEALFMTVASFLGMIAVFIAFAAQMLIGLLVVVSLFAAFVGYYHDGWVGAWQGSYVFLAYLFIVLFGTNLVARVFDRCFGDA